MTASESGTGVAGSNYTYFNYPGIYQDDVGPFLLLLCFSFTDIRTFIIVVWNPTMSLSIMTTHWKYRHASWMFVSIPRRLIHLTFLGLGGVNSSFLTRRPFLIPE